MLNPRVGGFAYLLRSRGPLTRSFLKLWQFLPPPQSPLLFAARCYGGLSSGCWNPGLCGLAWGWDHLLPRSPSWFLSTTHECETIPIRCCLSPPHGVPMPLCPSQRLCPTLTCLDECGFFKPLVVRLPYSSIFLTALGICFESSSNSF